jgi:signal peptidase
MVAVESASMEPNINQYDLVFVTEPGRFAPSEADDRGIATVERAEPTGYSTFNRAGSVIVYYEPGSVGPPIIHRAHLFVESGENWYDRANPAYINADSCAALANCPAPYAGYITKGDNEDSNQRYDQANGIAPVVEPDWVTGVARLRVPYLGWIRLAVTGVASVGPTIPATAGGIAGVGGIGYAVGRRRHRRR